ncbi:hypothetical protein L6164_013017 [Bauhinia variegata]|uniref:Uncharacterized protein n=1 Tax=Bauhinia variegata TaxID=167791 RepID=A0ACB9PD17_BAUVA|nr:hypothetical protein L6164_013017 [Bauhinia variegata]
MGNLIIVFLILLSISYTFAAIVSKDGSEDYTTIAEAIAQAPTFSAKPYIILVRAGIYEEYLIVPYEKTNIRLTGDGVKCTRIVGYRSTSGSLIPVNQNLAFANGGGPDAGPGVAVLNVGDKTAFYKCSFEGYQDTLWAGSGRQFYRQCNIYGTVDFILGNAAAVFQNCMLYARYNEFLVFTAQSRENQDQQTGFVFQNCKFTMSPEDSDRKSEVIRASLGRPWRAYSRVVILFSYIDSLIDPRGWEMYRTVPTNRLSYIEFGNEGPGSRTNGRVNWPGVKVFYDKSEVEGFTVSVFLSGDTWIPQTGIPCNKGL